MLSVERDPVGALVSVMRILEPLDLAGRQWVLQSAASRWNLSIQDVEVNAGEHLNRPVPSPRPDVIDDGQSAIDKKDIRAFIRSKRPVSDVQRVACFGFFIQRTKSLQGFTSKDIAETHTESGGSSFDVKRALDNATRQSMYLSNRANREKQLTMLGEDVVAALPNQELVKQIESEAKERGERRVRKKSSKRVRNQDC